MPPFGKAPLAIPGIGPLLSHNQQTVDQHKQRERSRSTPRPRQKSVRDFSRSRSVFIYNVGPFPASIPGASLGPQYIPALDVKLVEQNISGDGFFVAGPLVIEGNPAESYPTERGASWIEHDPAEHMGFGDHPGMHLALTLLGGGPQQSQSETDAMGLPIINLTKRGLFVSPIPAWTGSTGRPQEPNEEQFPDGIIPDDHRRAYQAAIADYAWRQDFYKPKPEALKEWKGYVTEARNKFIEWGGFKCDEANEAYKNGQFGQIRDQLYFVIAHLLKKTAVECPFLGSTVENTARKACRECGSTMQADKPRCPACKALQMSQADYDKWLKAQDAA
jgi:hypothetical protein